MEVYSRKPKSNEVIYQPTYVNDVLTKMEEKQGGGVNESVEITYNSDGDVNNVLENIHGDKTLYTFIYENGELYYIAKGVV